MSSCEKEAGLAGDAAGGGVAGDEDTHRRRRGRRRTSGRRLRTGRLRQRLRSARSRERRRTRRGRDVSFYFAERANGFSVLGTRMEGKKLTCVRHLPAVAGCRRRPDKFRGAALRTRANLFEGEHTDFFLASGERSDGLVIGLEGELKRYEMGRQKL